MMSFVEEYKAFFGLLVFGNIENLILSSQGVVGGVDPKILGGLSVLAVIVWLFIGTVATDVAMQYANIIQHVSSTDYSKREETIRHAKNFIKDHYQNFTSDYFGSFRQGLSTIFSDVDILILNGNISKRCLRSQLLDLNKKI